MSNNNGNGSVSKAWIQDGYTRTAYISREQSGLHPSISFVYRPMLVQDQAVVYSEMDKADARRRQQIASEAIKRRIVSWDIEGLSHEDASAILKLQPKLFTRIFYIIAGDDGGDPDPSETADLSTTERLLEEALAGSTKQEREDADVKN